MGWHHQNLPIKTQIFPVHIQPSLKNHRLQSGYLCRPLPSRGKYTSHSDKRICHFKLISLSRLHISSGVSLVKCELTPKTFSGAEQSSPAAGGAGLELGWGGARIPASLPPISAGNLDQYSTGFLLWKIPGHCPWSPHLAQQFSECVAWGPTF